MFIFWVTLLVSIAAFNTLCVCPALFTLEYFCKMWVFDSYRPFYVRYSLFQSSHIFRFYFYDECYIAFCSSHATVMDSFFFLFVCLFCRSLTSNLPNVNLPNVNLQIPKVPNLPVPVAGLSVNLPQMPSFSTPSWMAAIYDSECVFN